MNIRLTGLLRVIHEKPSVWNVDACWIYYDD